MKKLFYCLLGVLCAAALPLTVFADDEFFGEEQTSQAVMEGVYQFGQQPDASADSTQTGELGGSGVQTFALDPTVEGAAGLEGILISVLDDYILDSDAAQATSESSTLTNPSAITIREINGERVIYDLQIPAYSTGSNNQYISPEFAELLRAVINAHPEWYFLSEDYSISVIYRGGQYYIYSVTLYVNNEYPDGLYSEKLKEDRAALESKTQEIAASVNALFDETDETSNVTKAVLLHDYLSSHVIYDDSGSANRYNMYGALMENRAVCQGISLAYEYLLESCGIPSFLVSSEALNHTWNAVYIAEDDAWYQADCTWDQMSLGANRHTGLLLSKGEMTTVHRGGEDDQTAQEHTWAEKGYSDSWWSGLTVPVVYDANGNLYWSQNSGSENGYDSLIYTSPASDFSGNGTFLYNAGPYLTTTGLRNITASAPIACDGESLYVAEANTVYAFSLNDFSQSETIYPNRVSDPDSLRVIGLLSQRLPNDEDGPTGVVWYGGVTFGASYAEHGLLPVDGVVLEDANALETLQALIDWLAGLPLPENALPSAADLNNDGVTDLLDLVLLAQNR